MSDFHQNGPVTSQPRLVARPVEELEHEILTLTPKFPVSLVIPLVPAEMERPALARLLDQLVVTDLDGCLLDDETQSYESARPALTALARARCPLVLCSAKTRAARHVAREGLAGLTRLFRPSMPAAGRMERRR